MNNKVNPLVSVIIACFNDVKYIGQAVDSVRAQTYKNIEIIVVDDGSDKKTKAVLKEMEAKIDILIAQENKGVSAARNRGIELAKGPYIFILDSDDFLESTLIEKAVLQFVKSKEVRIVSCYANLINDKNAKFLKTEGGSLVSFLNNNCALGTSMYLKEDILAIHGYDENMHLGFEDWELNIRIMALGGSAKVIKEPLYNYRIKKKSRNVVAKRKRAEIIRYIVNKNKALYLKYIDETWPQLFLRMENAEKKNHQLRDSFEYRCGKLFVTPLRYLKKIMSK